MSWSISEYGSAPEVREKVAARFQSGLCEEPEEGIRLAAGKLIDQALEAQGPGTNVRVNAFGSHSKDYSSGAVRNSLSITITPI